MQCGACGREARRGASFCDGCGQKLGLACTNCRHELREDARFCDACGTATPLAAVTPVPVPGPAPPAALPAGGLARRRSDIPGVAPLPHPDPTKRRRREDLLAAAPADDEAAPPRERRGRRASDFDGGPAITLPPVAAGLVAAGKPALGERKQVTVLFSDVEGSMDLAESLDPERWRDIMDRFFNIFCGVVERYEGTVHQFVGDGAIAYFGAPIAHEDHARRACIAAIELGDELRRFGRELRESEAIGFHMRTGLNSGDVVVGAVGEDAHTEYVAIGHTVGLAERMQKLADPDTACISADTAALVRGMVRLRDRGAFEVKGARAPMQVYELIGVRGVGEQQEGDRRMPLVGRGVELAVLDASLRRAAGGDGQIVALIGDAGIGKRRLISEFAGRARELGLETIAIEALAHERNVPLLTIRALIHAFFGIDPAGPAGERRERIAAAFAALDPGASGELPLLLDLLGLGDGQSDADTTSPDGHRRRVTRLLRRLLRARTQEEPLLVVVQNLQWLDPASAERISDLIQAISGSRALLVMTYRPEHRARWAAEVTTVRLGPLNEAEQFELLEDVLGTDPTLEGLPARIAMRAAGNPLYLVEMVRALTDSGRLTGETGAYVLTAPLDDSAIPPTVEALIAARIDRLAQREKTVLQAAAVVGEEFDDDVLQRVTGISQGELDVALDALEAADILGPIDGGHAFRQTVVQEVAYRQQLEKRRRGLHGAAAAALADVDGELDQEHLALIAAHAERAGDLVPAAEWHAQAARAAEDEPVREREHWRHVRRLLAGREETDEWLERLGLSARVRLLELGWRMAEQEEDEQELHREARALAESSGHAAELVAVLVGKAVQRGASGELEECLALCAEAVDAAQRAKDPAAEAVASWMAYPLSVSGRLQEAHRLLSRGIQLCEAEPGLGSGVVVESQYAWCHNHRGLVNAWMGNVGAGQADAELAITLAMRHGDPLVESWARAALGTVLAMSGRPQEALASLDLALELADRIQHPLALAAARTQQGFALSAAGRATEGLALSETALARMVSAGLGGGWCADAHAAVAAGRLLTGDVHGAAESGHAAVSAARVCGATANEIPALLTLGHALCADASGDTITAARAAADRGLLLVKASGARAFGPALHALSAAVADLEGDAAAAAMARAACEDALSGTRLVARPVWRPAPLGPAPGPGRRDLADDAADAA